METNQLKDTPIPKAPYGPYMPAYVGLFLFGLGVVLFLVLVLIGFDFFSDVQPLRLLYLLLLPLYFVFGAYIRKWLVRQIEGGKVQRIWIVFASLLTILFVLLYILFSGALTSG